jgi:hypothetical protein
MGIANNAAAVPASTFAVQHSTHQRMTGIKATASPPANKPAYRVVQSGAADVAAPDESDTKIRNQRSWIRTG